MFTLVSSSQPKIRLQLNIGLRTQNTRGIKFDKNNKLLSIITYTIPIKTW